MEEIRPDGSRAIAFSDGTKKEISADGLSIIVSFSNGDVRHIFPDQKVVCSQILVQLFSCSNASSLFQDLFLRRDENEAHNVSGWLRSAGI